MIVLLFDFQSSSEVGEVSLAFVQLHNMVAFLAIVDEGLNIGKTATVREVVVQVDLLQSQQTRPLFQSIFLRQLSRYLIGHH